MTQFIKETCGVAFMRASMKCLSRVHSTAFALRKSLGGKRRMLKMFPEIEERKAPKMKVLQDVMAERLQAYLEYLAFYHQGKKSLGNLSKI